MQMKQISMRLSAAQLLQLAKLAKKLQISRASTIRFALSRLAENEGVLLPPDKPKG